MNVLFLTLTGLVGYSVKQYADKVWPKAEKYWPAVKQTAIKYKLSPYLLAAILYKESRFNPEAVGSAGEYGMGQFKKIAAEDVGVDFEALKRDPELQIEAAGKLLKLNCQRSGSIVTAVRAYNVGIGRALKDGTAGADYAFDVFKMSYIGAFYNGIKGFL